MTWVRSKPKLEEVEVPVAVDHQHTPARSASEGLASERSLALAKFGRASLLGLLAAIAGCNTSAIDSVRPDEKAAKLIREKLATQAATAATAADMAAVESGGGETATLKGKFVLDGTAPTPEAIAVNQDAAVCGIHNLVRESLMVKDGAIQNVCIWLSSPKIKGQAAGKQIVMDNKDCRFNPHVVAMQAGDTLVLKNSDPVPHNTKGSPRSNQEFNVIIPPNSTQDIKTITKSEGKPFKVECSIHSWMAGYVVVTDGPFAAATGEDGTFEIKGLPANTPLEFQVWQEAGNQISKVNVDGKDANWSQGRFKITLKPGENDLGTIKATIGKGT